MKRLQQRLALLALAVGFNGLVWLWLGVVSVAMCAPLYACLFAGPLLALLSRGVQAIRALAYRGISGRHFEHHGIAIDIVDDATSHRWLRVADVRKVVAGLPDDRSLLRRHPEGAKCEGFPPVVRIKAETLAEMLKSSADPRVVRFKNWLEREVAFPARQMRARGPLSGGV